MGRNGGQQPKAAWRQHDGWTDKEAVCLEGRTDACLPWGSPGTFSLNAACTYPWKLDGSLITCRFLEKAAFLFGRNSVGVVTPWDWAAGTHLVFIMGCRGTGRGKSAPSSILAAFHLAQHVVFIIEREGAGEERPHKRVAFLLNKIKYSETK